MIANRMIYYLCPDNPEPSGGVRRLYRHVEILNKHGVPAAIVHLSRDFRIHWFKSGAPIVYFGELFGENLHDFLVIPEVMTPLMNQTRHYKLQRVAIALNWALIHKHLPLGRDWRTFGVNQAIAGSRYEAEFIRKTMGIDSYVLVSGIDASLFYPSSEASLKIAYMPRKDTWAPLIIRAFQSQYPDLASIPILLIRDIAHHAVGDLMREAAVYLTATFPEGMARPPLEAMACGCLVVGFSGRGSLEYMRHGVNCYVADDGDILGAAAHLARAVRDLKLGVAGPMREAALNTATQYSLENEERNVLRYWSERLNNAYARADPDEPRHHTYRSDLLNWHSAE